MNETVANKWVPAVADKLSLDNGDIDGLLLECLEKIWLAIKYKDFYSRATGDGVYAIRMTDERYFHPNVLKVAEEVWQK